MGEPVKIPAVMPVNPQALLGLGTCEKCSHCWTILNAQGADYACRRFPPQVTHVVMGVSQQGPQINPLSGFPIVMKDWKCGEFRPRLQS